MDMSHSHEDLSVADDHSLQLINSLSLVWGSKIGFCLVEDNKRTTFDYENLDSRIMDITYYNGRVYAFDCAHRLDGGKRKSLLVVIRQGVVDNDDYKTKSFQVWTYDLGIEAAAYLNDDSSNAYELSDMCFEEDLTHEFMEMMKRDISRRAEEEGG
ncbi:hypothetical protein Tco_0228296 [Tanacetum coccineum]